jgi:hypothetical protein
MRVVERPQATAARGPSDTRRFIALAAGAAAIAALVVVAAVAVGWRLLLRNGRMEPREEPPPAAEPFVAEPFVAEPSAVDSPPPESESPPTPPAPLAIANDDLDVLGPEPELPDSERVATGVTYEAHPVGRRRGGYETVFAVLLVGIALVGGFVLAHPHIGELGAPNEVLQGSAIDVPYTSSGLGALRYRVTSSSGVVLADGDLDRRSGTLHIPIPAAAHDETYRIRLTLAGPFGDTANEATVNSHAMPQARIITRTAAVPSIRSFAVTRESAKSPFIVAFYDVSAERGTVRLVDSRGIQYGVVPLRATGQARFALPAGVDPGTLAVELHAIRAGATSDSRIALPGGTGDIAVATSPRSGGAPAAQDAPIAVPASVGPGPIHVRILHHYADLHVALVDGNARKIVGVVVGANRNDILLAHPRVAAAMRVTVQATYRMNNESDMVIRPVILVPSSGG